MKQLIILAVRFYRACISPLFPPTCIYTPTCSSYTYQAIDKDGLLWGSFKGFCRILRCNPFAKGGFDPVKENYRGRAKWLI